jgi:hypothetical protein
MITPSTIGGAAIRRQPMMTVNLDDSQSQITASASATGSNGSLAVIRKGHPSPQQRC